MTLPPPEVYRQAGLPKAEVPPEEIVRRQRVEAERLARLTPGEWQLWIDRSAANLGIPRATLEASVKAIIAQHEKEARERKTEAERERRRVEKATAVKRKNKERAFKVWTHYRRRSRKNASTNLQGASMRTLPRCARNLRDHPHPRLRASLNPGPRLSTAQS